MGVIQHMNLYYTVHSNYSLHVSKFFRILKAYLSTFFLGSQPRTFWSGLWLMIIHEQMKTHTMQNLSDHLFIKESTELSHKECIKIRILKFKLVASCCINFTGPGLMINFSTVLESLTLTNQITSFAKYVSWIKIVALGTRWKLELYRTKYYSGL